MTAVMNPPEIATVRPADVKSEDGLFQGVSQEKKGSLRPAHDAIGNDVQARIFYKSVYVVSQSVLLWLASLALLIAFDNPIIVIFGWVFGALALSGMFIVGHDAAHGVLFNSKRANKITAKLLFLPELHSYEGWLLGHNRIHHGHTVREQMDFVWQPTTPQQYDAMTTAQKIQHKIEWSIFGAGLYYIRNIWWNKMFNFTPPERFAKRIKRDNNLVIAFAVLSVIAALGIGYYKYASIAGALWFLMKVLVIPLIGFMYVIGWTVYVQHVSPEISWQPRRQWNSYLGQVEGTTVLDAPKIFNWLFFYNIFVHVPHHVDVRIPCYNLNEAANRLIEAFPGIVQRSPLKAKDYLRSIRSCKVYDFDSHEWQRYNDYKFVDLNEQEKETSISSSEDPNNEITEKDLDLFLESLSVGVGWYPQKSIQTPKDN